MKAKAILNVALLFVILLLNCSEKSSPDFDPAQVEIEWEVIENGVGNDRSAFAFTFSNHNERPMPQRGWTLYFNQLPRSFYPESVQGGVKIEQISGDYYQLSPTEEFQPIAPGEERRITFETSLYVIKKSGAPAGLFFVMEGETPVPVKNYIIRPFTEDRQINRDKSDQFPIPTPSFRYEQNAKLSSTQPQALVPTPVSQTTLPGTTELNGQFNIQYPEELEKEAQLLAEALKNLFGLSLSLNATGEGKAIKLQLDNSPLQPKQREAYKLEIKDNIIITGADPMGVFYGIQSLIGLIPVKYLAKADPNILLTNVEVLDYPRFEYRGMFLDVARNFSKKETVLKLLDLMAYYKLNKFHFHICDDEGWRLEISGLPELTEVGANRGFTLDEKDMLYPRYGSGPVPGFPGSGYYTRGDFKEILQYAADRHIEVIPEIDMPGHARAAIRAMEARYEKFKAAGDMDAATQYLLTDFGDQSVYSSAQAYTDNVISVCRESTYEFLEKIVSEVVQLYEEADVPLNIIHTGGDEVPIGVWEKSPICQQLIAENEAVESVQNLWSYYLGRFNEILSKRGLVTAGWEEVAMQTVSRGGKKVHEPNPEFVDDNFMPYFWNAIFGWGNEDVGYQLANAGYKVVMCNASNFYFDLAYDKDPEETGLFWAGFVNTRSPYEFIPYDLFKAADMGRFGEMLDPDEVSKGKTELTEKGRKNIVGIQAQLWSETIRNPEMLEYYIFPKMISFAERAWSPPPAWEKIESTSDRRQQLNQGWNQFANTIGKKEMPRLDYLAGGVNYRIPPPGAQLENGKLLANTAFPGLIIRYTLNGSEPNNNSAVYREALPVDGQVRLKAFSPQGHSSRTVTIGVDQNIQ